jgi:predicted PurR-regulated permease PerM
MQNDYISRAVEVSIQVGLVILLVAACLLILSPFLPLLAWGIIIAIAVYPGHLKLKKFLGGRNGLASVISTIILLAIVIVPVILLAGSVVDGLQGLAASLRAGPPVLPPLPKSIETLPLVGAHIKSVWDLASKDLPMALRPFAPQIKAAVPSLLSASANVGAALIQSILAMLIAGVLLASSAKASNVAHSLANRLFGDKGPEFETLACLTVRSVTTGIVGVAFIQAFFATIGFLIAGLPGAGLWAVIFFLAAVLQVGALVLIAAVIYMFAIATTTKAAIFLVWCVVIALMDNVLKPLLLGRGVAVPMLVVFLGVIGGFLALGIIGLFVGAILLSVGYKLAAAWLQGTPQLPPEAVERSIAAGT